MEEGLYQGSGGQVKKMSWDTFTKPSLVAYGCLLPSQPPTR